ncbi:hypothetical protein ZIOFF_012895 [Zingiber officinale]|uniref:Legume lectin domain-containing protein n=1 Tax=Zingiber officinale TaxID=94328 RepID=A0A8J5I0K6_ZINOF|nr:hypothetical protein ZIOFF_012895 [Zingiber officinale]
MILYKARILPVLFLAIVVPLATSLSFNFPSFDPASQSKITFEGDGDIIDSTIMLTKDGGYLGLYSNSTIFVNSTSSAVAVEFDTFSNYEWDPEGEHLGIDINSITSSKYVRWNSSIREHRVGNARVDYDSITHNLSLFLTYPETNQSPSANYSISYIVDLREVLPEHVAVGFSAATGNYTEMHSIISWSFNSTLQPKKNKQMDMKEPEEDLICSKNRRKKNSIEEHMDCDT